ncbi:alpha/beta hydrolase [Paracoccus tegillarcae]|uniref:Lipolytic protein n=1 Tax=Paracoccus tegillarcae TaxID=1529068 RepID=A0A2K9F1P4_9RHOB|nr:alpha/beta hydrolase [Paracoccus tegillarcae]AUH33051.1 lipolytic protein [Paracoccus tegillarcae]
MDIADFERQFDQGLTAMADLPLPNARQYYDALCASFAPALPNGMTLTDDRIGNVPVRRHIPRHHNPGVVVYIHGGGFNLGSLDSHQGVAAGLAEALSREVVSIGYRLLPEAGYADALDDCRQVIAEISPAALVGDSAGGRLILDLCHDPDASPPLGLIYPPAGTLTAETLGPDAPLLSRDDVFAAWEAMAQGSPAVDDLSPPARQIEVLAVSRDPLTAPLEDAVSRWREDGAEVGYYLAADMLHGCLHAREQLPAMAEAWRSFCHALKQRLDN